MIIVYDVWEEEREKEKWNGCEMRNFHMKGAFGGVRENFTKTSGRVSGASWTRKLNQQCRHWEHYRAIHSILLGIDIWKTFRKWYVCEVEGEAYFDFEWGNGDDFGVEVGVWSDICKMNGKDYISLFSYV